MEKQSFIKYYVVNDFGLYCSLNFVAFHYIPNENGKWVKCDYTRCISDYLYGFDESEPMGSPYRFWNNSISSQIQEICEDEVIKRIGKKAILESFSLFK